MKKTSKRQSQDLLSYDLGQRRMYAYDLLHAVATDNWVDHLALPPHPPGQQAKHDMICRQLILHNLVLERKVLHDSLHLPQCPCLEKSGYKNSHPKNHGISMYRVNPLYRRVQCFLGQYSLPTCVLLQFLFGRVFSEAKKFHHFPPVSLLKISHNKNK